MADKKITQLTNITGANLVDADEFVVVDISADETKAITLGELKEAFDSGSGFVRITGDTMTGALDVQSTITTSGGVVFGSTGGSVTSKTLDDYEEGTWTPVFTDNTNNVDLSGGTGGFYTKTGGVVVVSFDIYSVNISTLSGGLFLNTLPFVSKDSGLGSGIMHIAGTSGGTNLPVLIYPISGSTRLTLYKAVSGSVGVAQLGTADLNSSVSVRMTLTYFTNS